MDDKNPLTYKRETLIEVLNERLAETESKRDEQKKKADERNKKARDMVVELLDEFPSFLVNVTNILAYHQGGRRPGTEAFREHIENAYALRDEVEVNDHDPDSRIKRLIRVYEKAEDVEVKVTVNDEVFTYL